MLNSKVICSISTTSDGDDKSNTPKVVVNTIDFTNSDFEEFVEISETIERVTHERRSHGRRYQSRTTSMDAATRTREEVFECIDIDNNQFNAVEHQTSYDPEKKDRADLVKSIENIMNYLDGDVQVLMHGSGISSPTKKTPIKSKVASILASFCRNCCKTPTTFSLQKKTQTECKSNIQKLKKRYESTTETETTPSPKWGKKSKYSKLTRRNKVKQMASLFNQKINQMVRSTTPETETSETLSYRLQTSLSSSNFSLTLKSKSPKLNSKLPNFITKLASPKPSSFFRRKPQSLKTTSSVSSLASKSLLMERKQMIKHPSTTCLVAENVFCQLSVKDKILLYNKFIDDMSRRNPKLQKHSVVLETNINKNMQHGEVVIENQNSVKHIRDTIEAKSVPEKSFSKYLPSSSTDVASKCKEYENNLQSNTCLPLSLTHESQDSLNVSSVAVVLKDKPDQKKSKKKNKSQGGNKNDGTFDESVVDTSLKRTQNMISSSISVEPLDPPKKIRRTRNERLTPSCFFKNQDLEKLFFHWLEEKNGIAFDITPENDNKNYIKIVPKNSRDNILQPERVEKILEIATKKLEEERKDNNLTSLMKDDATVLMKNSIDDETTKEKSIVEVEVPLEVKSSIGEIKANETQGINLSSSSINKTTSEESYAELKNLNIANRLMKPSHKKKVRRALTLKNNPNDSSDSEYKTGQLKKQPSCTLPKSKKCSDYVKKLILKTFHSSSTTAESLNHTVCSPEQGVFEFADHLKGQANSPSKIKNTLTILASHSQPSVSDYYDSDLLKAQDASESRPSLQKADAIESSKPVHVKQKTIEIIDTTRNKLMTESFIDQGFETATTEMDSRLRLTNLSHFDSPNHSKDLHSFSTNFKSQLEMNTQVISANQSVLSPISDSSSTQRVAPHKMTAIKEDVIKEDSEELHCIPSSINESTTSSTAEQISANQTHSPLNATCNVASSQFWITSRNSIASLTIDHYEADKLKLLSSIFNQKAIKTRDISFGIDDQKFSFDNSSLANDLIQKLPTKDNCSQYWFATGDVIIPFKGNQLTTKKIQSFFNYIKNFVGDMASIKFGIDAYEFSNVDHVMAKPVKTSDLGQSKSEAEESDISRTYSVLNGQHNDKVDELSNLKTNHSTEESETFEQMFEEASLLDVSKTHTEKLAWETQFTIPDMLKTLKIQQLKLTNLEEQMQNCNKNKATTKSIDTGDIPENMCKLRSIISAIDNIGDGNGFKTCTPYQLESFMFYIRNYTNLCLAHYKGHIEKILDVVGTQGPSLNVTISTLVNRKFNSEHY